MILHQVLEFLRDRDIAAIPEIARAVDSTPDAVRSMLETLQRKGRVHRYHPPQGCGSSCQHCAQAEMELFRVGRVDSTAPEVNCAAASLRLGRR